MGKSNLSVFKPSGKFVFAEFHPVVWMFDDEFEKIGYNYFNVKALIENQSGTYADKSANINTTYVMWNHGIGGGFEQPYFQ